MPVPALPITLFQSRTNPLLRAREPHLTQLVAGLVGETPLSETGTFSEFYCNSGGSNLNAGSTSGAAVYTSANGNWNGSTIFTVQDGTNPSLSIAVGDFVSVFANGSTETGFIARVTAVQNATNGTVTVTGTFIYGAAPASGTGTRTLIAGGAWFGPNSASIFPLGLTGTMGSLQNVAGNKVRVNWKNDRVYSSSNGSFFFNTCNSCTMQGYRSVAGDGGRAVFNATSTNGGFQGSGAAGQIAFTDLIFDNLVASNTQSVMQWSGNSGGCTWRRCVFRNGPNSGFRGNQVGICHIFIECEAYNNNRAAGANKGGWELSNGIYVLINCYSHDNVGGGHGVSNESGTDAKLALINSILADNTGCGLSFRGSSYSQLLIWGNDFYHNTSDAVLLTPISSLGNDAIIINNIFTRNGGKAVNNTGALQGGVLHNNARGAGTEANGSADTLGSIINAGTDITLPTDTSPYQQPSSGNFKLIAPQVLGAGRGFFLQTGLFKSGTVGFPDIGSAQAASGVTSLNGTTTTLRDGYVNHTYYVLAEYLNAFGVTIQSGSLPAGLTLSQPTTSSFLISGTPTTVGSYSAVLAFSFPGSTGSGTFTLNITIYDDPDEGVGGVGGG